ncbi:chemotaxis protein CheW [Kineosporia babensis]|uniref:Chemotaxis protein CheW n=1 Tax=Kineosporia babensis TaxID=499548 RepID=A0A9X1NLR1_9ACTN|nr:chemotaxis protein CheW [Kineosporia babensis]MCD5315393.1 chemotaxis protein CheW [Kineosporia babensis]
MTTLSIAPGGADTDHTQTTYGLFAAGEACVGVPLGDVREVTPCPDQLEVLPVSAPGMLGAVNLRGQVIPVLDLLAMHGGGQVGTGEAEEADQSVHRSRRVIVVLLREQKLLGLIVDGVHGVTTPSGMTRMGTPDGGRLMVSHTFTRPETGGIVSVLDVDAMFALPGVPLAQEEGRTDGVFSGGGEDSSSLHTGGQGSMLLVRCADHRLAISIESVHTILPRVKVRHSPLRHGSCKGVTDYDGAEIPVFDPLELAGLGTLSSDDTTEGVAIRFQDGLVVMMLSEVLDLTHIASVEQLRLPSVQVPGRRYLQNVLRVPEQGDFLTLVVEKMLEHDDLRALSRLNTPHEGRAEAVPAQRSGDAEPGSADADTWTRSAHNETYLTFSLGAADKGYAVPLHQVKEILEFPAQYSVLDSANDQMLGLFTHRDTVVPLYRLSRMLGVADSALAKSYVLIVSTDPDAAGGQVVGLVVHALRAIEKAVWEDPEPKRSGHPAGSLEAALSDVTMLRLSAIGTNDEPRMLGRLDLAAIGTALVPAAEEEEPELEVSFPETGEDASSVLLEGV